MSRKTEGEWQAIRSDYERGEGFHVLEKCHEVSHTAMRKRAKKENWRQDRVAGEPQFVPSVRKPDSATGPVVEIGQALIVRMLDELDAVTSKQGELAELIDAETADDRNTNRRQGMLRAIDLGSRSTIVKNLATAAKTFADVAAGADLGKKALAEKKAATAAVGTDWAEDLLPSSLN